MNKILLTACLFVLTIKAQSQLQKWKVSAYGGGALPVGRFAAQALRDPESGFAKSGESGSLSFSYALGRRFGLSTLFRFQQNPLNRQSAIDKDYFALQAWGTKITVTSEDWRMGVVVLGGYYSFPIKHKLSLDFTLMAGGLKTSAPKATQLYTEFITAYSSSTGVELDTAYTLYTKSKDPLKWTFAYVAGVSVTYKTSKRLSFLAGVDYTASMPTVTRMPVTYVNYVVTPNGPAAPSGGTLIPIGELRYKQPLTMLNCSIGAEIQF
jgi:hypothetical protein